MPELKKLLKEQGLSLGGNKAELIARLQGKVGSDFDHLESSHEETDDLLEEEVSPNLIYDMYRDPPNRVNDVKDRYI